MVAVTYGSARIATVAPAAKAAPKGKGFFARFMDALIEARLRQAYRELALHQHLNYGWTREDEPVERNELPFGR
jgi:hypothetical protein